MYLSRLFLAAILLSVISSCSDPQEFPGELRVYPNPTSGLFNIELFLKKESEVIMQLAGGETTAQMGFSSMLTAGKNPILDTILHSGIHGFRLDLWEKPDGLYLLDVSIDGIGSRTTLIKQ